MSRLERTMLWALVGFTVTKVLADLLLAASR